MQSRRATLKYRYYIFNTSGSSKEDPYRPQSMPACSSAVNKFTSELKFPLD